MPDVRVCVEKLCVCGLRRGMESVREQCTSCGCTSKRMQEVVVLFMPSWQWRRNPVRVGRFPGLLEFRELGTRCEQGELLLAASHHACGVRWPRGLVTIVKAHALQVVKVHLHRIPPPPPESPSMTVKHKWSFFTHSPIMITASLEARVRRMCEV